MKRWVARAGLALLVLLLAAFVVLASWEPFAARKSAPPPDRAYTAEIVRDEFGVPHIHGATDADVAYGVAIAHAEDDFSTLQDVAAMSKGRYGAIAGEDGAAVDYVYHLLDARGTVEREFPALPADTRALFEAYAAGLNQYAAEHPSEVKLANLFPINGEDIAAGFALRQPFFFGLDSTIGPLVEGEDLRPEHGPAIPGAPGIAPSGEPIMGDEPATTAQRAPLPVHMGEDGALAGSNAFAIAPEKSGDGVTRLVSNSHQPWRGGVAWYELVVESDEGWHFAGANFPGSPYPFLGHNETLGWTNTVNRADLIDVYQLELDDSGTRYRLDGEWRDLEQRAVTLPVRIGPIVLPVRRTVWRSIHGPVVKNDRGAFAIRYAGMGNIGSLDEYYRLNKAETFEEWRAILARMDVPSTNFIYADQTGRIAMFYNAAIPARKPGANWRGVLPGDDSSLIWQRTVDFDALPQIVDPASGWLFNANNAPYSAAGPGSDLSPEDFAPEMGVELTTTNRSIRAARLMSEADIIDRTTLERIKYDTVYDRVGYVAELFDEIAALDLSGDPELARAQALLGKWDYSADGVGRADALALLMIKDFMASSYNGGERPDVEDTLRDKVAHLKAHFGRIDPQMSALLRLRQGTDSPYAVDLPLDGGSDTLRASTTWDVDADGRLSVRHGDSFLMFVEWTPGERVVSQSIQPFGAATTRPDSPHYTDQAPLFVRHQVKPVHFWRADVLEHAAQRKTVSNR